MCPITGVILSALFRQEYLRGGIAKTVSPRVATRKGATAAEDYIFIGPSFALGRSHPFGLAWLQEQLSPAPNHRKNVFHRSFDGGCFCHRRMRTKTREWRLPFVRRVVYLDVRGK